MRNCLYMGPATRFLEKQATDELFARATGRSLKSQTMRDREFVNRFCAFQILPLDEYRGDMDEFLARALIKMGGLSTEEFDVLEKDFRTGMTNNYVVFGKQAFRKHQSPDAARNVLNASLWDVMSTGLSRQLPDEVERRADALRRATWDLMDDVDFVKAITYSPNSTAQVLARFEKATSMFRGVFG
jgi:hypothetical protein